MTPALYFWLGVIVLLLTAIAVRIDAIARVVIEAVNIAQRQADREIAAEHDAKIQAFAGRSREQDRRDA